MVDVKNYLFDDNQLSVLLHPSQWRIIGSLMETEGQALPDSPRQEWIKLHSHRHAHREIVIVLKGEGEYGYLGKPYACSPGTVFLFDTFEDHTGYPQGYPDCEHLLIYAHQLDCIFRLLTVKNGSTSESSKSTHHVRTESTGLINMDIVFGGTDGHAAARGLQILRSRSALSLLVLAMVEEGYQSPDANEEASLQGSVIATLKRYIRETAGKGVSLDALAEMSGYSKYHFHRLFNQHVGMTVHEYVDYCRARRVDEMLQSGSSMKETSHALGFSCKSAFCRWLRKQDKYPYVRKDP